MSTTAAEGAELPPTEHRWPGADGPWHVILRWRIIDGRPECTGIDMGSQQLNHVTTTAEGLAVTTAVLREMPFADWIAADRAAMSPEPVVSTGLRKSTRERLAKAAEIYQAALRDGRAPVKAVAEHFGISQGGASNLVARSRAAGLLPPTSKGVAYG